METSSLNISPSASGMRKRAPTIQWRTQGRGLPSPYFQTKLIYRFGRPVPVLSMATNNVLDYIYNTHNHLITQWNHTLLSPCALEVYAETIYGKGAALKNCFGFVDGTVRPLARPDEHQRIMYNRHKRVHALKFQSLALPNRLHDW